MKENMLASLGKGDSQAEAAKTERSRKQEATLTALGMRFHSGKGRMRSSIKNRRAKSSCRLSTTRRPTKNKQHDLQLHPLMNSSGISQTPALTHQSTSQNLTPQSIPKPSPCLSQIVLRSRSKRSTEEHPLLHGTINIRPEAGPGHQGYLMIHGRSENSLLYCLVIGFGFV